MKELRALRTRRNREESGRFLAEGLRVVEDLLASPLTVRLVANTSSMEDTERGQAIVREIDRRGLPRREVHERDLLDLAVTDSPQGIVAVADIPHYGVDSLDPVSGGALLLVLDGVQDPGNFGTLVRSAEALGGTGIVALPGTVDPWNPKSVRAAAGSSFRLPILQLSWQVLLVELRRMDFTILGADSAGRPVRDLRSERVALVVGNEGAGLSPEVRDSVDELAAVPLKGRAESLNVAAAAAILLYELAS